ncbi:hypothetical protein RB608_27080 [Nocardioides sp. LHD-245]|uniref:hypothetical protein n=1 Tax=Nocardioides sp. LHD-245 TaxID=3051387 RepID=UPI0027E0E086|nr:hypothetical protein [Nocardioides sp. LHD-245]
MLKKHAGHKTAVALSVAALSAVVGSGWVVGTVAHADEGNSSASPSVSKKAAGDVIAQLCPEGSVPMLDIDRFPTADTVGADSVADAVDAVAVRFAVDEAIFAPFATGGDVPVWATVGRSDYIVTPVEGGGWFASPARLEGCNSLDELRRAGGLGDGQTRD